MYFIYFNIIRWFGAIYKINIYICVFGGGELWNAQRKWNNAPKTVEEQQMCAPPPTNRKLNSKMLHSFVRTAQIKMKLLWLTLELFAIVLPISKAIDNICNRIFGETLMPQPIC